MMDEVLIVPQPRHMQFSGEWLGFDGFKNLPEHMARDFNIPTGSWEIRLSPGGEDSCNLSVGDGYIEASGNPYICYATAIQLTMQRKGYIPRVEVSEKFSFRVRGFHLDIARGGVPKVETFKDLIRWLFLLKYNKFFIYFEDLYPWRSYPDIGVLRGRLSEDEWRSIVEYGKLYGIDIVPSLELLGHMENILSLPKYAKFRELWWDHCDGSLNASSDDAREFAKRLLQDALETTDSELIHIGGDETWSLGRGRSLDSSGFVFKGPELYIRHYRDLIDLVKKFGKTPVVWGDMLTGIYLPPEERGIWERVIKDPLWDEVIVANWNYEPLSVDDFRKFIDLVGHYDRQWACPGLSNWNRFYPNFDRALVNVKNFLTAAKEKGLPGFLITAWGDDGEECLFSYLKPLILASMELAEGSGDWEEKWLRLSGEDEGVLKARKLFGRSTIADRIKYLVYLDRGWLISDEDKGRLREELGSILGELRDVKLPPDLEFMRKLLELGLKVINGEVKEEDYWDVIGRYAELWLSERKPEGLSNILSRFAKSILMLRYGLRS